MRRAVFAAIAILACGCTNAGPETAPSASPSTLSPAPSRTRLTRPVETPDAYPAYAATARGASVEVRATPGGAVTRRLANPQESGAPLTFLVKGALRTDWLEVYLPVRPNGSTGWVRADAVTIAGVPYRVDVLRAAHRLRLYERGTLLREFPVGIGTASTPTPGGTFYLKELLIPTNPGGFYGPYAYGLSGFSNVLTTFAGGEGVIGLHGTNDPRGIGRDVSHGCVRMHNADITYLAKLLPLGTPVRILA